MKYIFDWYVNDDLVMSRELEQVGGLPVQDGEMDEDSIQLRDEKLRSYLSADIILQSDMIDSVSSMKMS